MTVSLVFSLFTNTCRGATIDLYEVYQLVNTPLQNRTIMPGESQQLVKLFYFFGGHQSFSLGPLIPLFWTSGNVCPGFQTQGGSSHLHASSPVCNRILRFTSVATPADLLVASMAVKLFLHISTIRCKNGGHASPTQELKCLISNYVGLKRL